MFDFTGSPEFMTALRAAMLVAAAELGIGAGRAARDPENEWLTAQEARDYLSLSESAFLRLRKRLEDGGRGHELVVSHSLNNTEPRWQKSSLQRFMRRGAPALPKPEPAPAVSGKPLNGKPHVPLHLVPRL